VDTNYTLRCYGAAGEIERSVSVSVVALADLPKPEPAAEPLVVRQSEPRRQVRDTPATATDARTQAMMEEARRLSELLEQEQAAADGYDRAGPPALAYHCCDMTGMQRCPLASPVLVGSPCFCPFQGTGISCP
jgi:hypothetical protein